MQCPKVVFTIIWYLDVPSFDKLSETEREDFVSYQVVIRDIGKVEENLIREIFQRINLTKFKHEDIEIHNAIYDGKFIQVAKQLSEEVESLNTTNLYR